jgi:hypothetical protein
MKKSLLGLAMAFFMSATAMAAHHDESGDAAPAAHRSPSPEGAEVAISNIEDGAVVPTTFLVQFSVTGMDIAPAGTDIENTGHHHLLIDVEEFPNPNLPLPANEHFIHFGGGQTETTLTLPEGTHTLQLVFADYMHIPHDPVVKSEPITIVVSADAEGMEGEAADE